MIHFKEGLHKEILIAIPFGVAVIVLLVLILFKI